jgi:hypothetical protein
LLYGEFVRTPHLDIAEKIIPISRLSIYAGQGDRVKSFQEKVPLIYTSAWKAKDGSVGIAVASISDKSSQISFNFDSDAYGLGEKGTIDIVTANDKRTLTSYSNNKIMVDFQLPARGICFLEIKND